MGNSSYHNPVQTVFGFGSLEKLTALLGNRKAALVTTPGTLKRGVAKRIAELAKQELKATEVCEPPSFEWLDENYDNFWQQNGDAEVIIAIGGGSVIDAAKALSVRATSGPRKGFAAIKDHLQGKSKLDNYEQKEIIAIATTAGTGSEVTPWATLWHLAEKKKYSLHLPTLWPKVALIDPELTITVPWQTTLIAGLDALSHALEAIWNVNANVVSTSLAIEAATTIMATLPQLKKELNNKQARIQMHRASLLAGLAFSNTKTALAHALSYPFTMKFKVLHGLACSFTLPAVLRHNRGHSHECDEALSRIFSVDVDKADEKLATFLHSLGVATDYKSYGAKDAELEEIIKTVGGNPRFGNNINPSVDGLFNALAKENSA